METHGPVGNNGFSQKGAKGQASGAKPKNQQDEAVERAWGLGLRVQKSPGVFGKASYKDLTEGQNLFR